MCRIWSIWEASSSSVGHHTEKAYFPWGFCICILLSRQLFGNLVPVSPAWRNWTNLCLLQRKKIVDETKTLSEEISKLNELLSSKKLIFQVRHFQPSLQWFHLVRFACLSCVYSWSIGHLLRVYTPHYLWNCMNSFLNKWFNLGLYFVSNLQCWQRTTITWQDLIIELAVFPSSYCIL